MSDKKNDENKATKDGDKAPDVKVVKEEISETRHAVVINGEKVNYTATAGNIVLKEEEGEPKASIFFVAYTRDDDGDGDDAAHRRERPLTFSFNGGPGSSSVWLHLGVLGPRRVLMDEDGNALPPQIGRAHV